MKAVRLLAPSLAMISLGAWLGWLYFSSDFGAVVIFLIIFAPQPLIGGVVGGIVGSASARLLARRAVEAGPRFGNLRYFLLSLVFWSAAGIYLGGCVAIAAAILIALLLSVLPIFGVLFVPVVYSGALGVSGVVVALTAFIVDRRVASRPGLSYEQSVWAPPGYALLSLLVATPALIGLGACCLAVVWFVSTIAIGWFSPT